MPPNQVIGPVARFSPSVLGYDRIRIDIKDSVLLLRF